VLPYLQSSLGNADSVTYNFRPDCPGLQQPALISARFICAFFHNAQRSVFVHKVPLVLHVGLSVTRDLFVTAPPLSFTTNYTQAYGVRPITRDIHFNDMVGHLHNWMSAAGAWL
jgi:hypothetical protein